MLNVLKENLSEELYTQVSEALKGKELDKYIPKARFDEVNEKAKQLVGYEDMKTQNLEMVEKLKGYDELKAKADKVETMTDYEEIKTGFAEIKSKYETTLSSNQELILKGVGLDEKFIKFGLSQIKVEEGQDFKEAAEAYAESNPQFKAETFQQINSQFSVGGGTKAQVPTDAGDYLVFRETHDAEGNLLDIKK